MGNPYTSGQSSHRQWLFRLDFEGHSATGNRRNPFNPIVFNSTETDNSRLIATSDWSVYTTGLPFTSDSGASDGLPPPYQGQNRQETEALQQVQRVGQLPFPLQKVPQGS